MITCVSLLLIIYMSFSRVLELFDAPIALCRRDNATKHILISHSHSPPSYSSSLPLTLLLSLPLRSLPIPPTLPLTLTGTVPLSTLHEWVLTMLPDVSPRIADDSTVEHCFYKNAFTGAATVVEYRKNEVECVIVAQLTLC